MHRELQHKVDLREEPEVQKRMNTRASQILPAKRATSLFPTHSPIRLQMGVFFHQPNPLKRKKGEKKKTVALGFFF